MITIQEKEDVFEMKCQVCKVGTVIDTYTFDKSWSKDMRGTKKVCVDCLARAEEIDSHNRSRGDR